MIMSPTELKMQPTIHLQSKPGYGRGKIQVNFASVLWVAILNCDGRIITCEILCILEKINGISSES
jgi:hypothetical protein